MSDSQTEELEEEVFLAHLPFPSCWRPAEAHSHLDTTW